MPTDGCMFSRPFPNQVSMCTAAVGPQPMRSHRIRTADSIVKQAVEGFDFTQTIKRAYADGVRVFIEAGPRASCTRMIDQILIDQPHLAVAANHGSENEIASLLRCLARLAAERVPMDLNPLYAGLESASAPNQSNERKIVLVPVGGHMLSPGFPNCSRRGNRTNLYRPHLKNSTGCQRCPNPFNP